MIKFSINHNVRVRLTDTGREHLRKQHIELFGNADKFSLPKEDADGWSRWQMHHLMARLGGDAIPCSIGPVPFETEILIECEEKP